MADRAGGTYTPNRKPRRGRGAGNTPRGSRGRGGGDNGESTPTASTETSPAVSTPTPTGQQQFSPPPPVPVPAETTPQVTVKVTPATPSEGKPFPEKKTSVLKEEPKPKMESPLEKAVVSQSSTETFSTPESFIDDKDKTMSPAVVPKSPGTSSKDEPAEPAKISENTQLEPTAQVLSSIPSGNDSSGITVPDKPPRKTSQSDKPPKVFEALPDTEKVHAPRPSGEPPLTVDIETEPESKMQSTTTDSATVTGSQTESSGSGPVTRGRKITPSSVSPSGYAYGLGGPVGKPGYGVSSSAHGNDDDPWSTVSLKARRTSISEITKAAKGFTGRQWITLIVFGLTDMFSAMIISLQAPFYPPEAESKGATATEYGLVFGAYELTVFLVSPFFGKFINRLGPKLVFNMGIILTSLSCICFGLLDKVEDHTLFISLSFIFRICEAIGASAFVTSSFAIIANEFTGSVATTFASLETFFGIGLIIGPTFGGALFQLGGYMLPFAVTGVCLFILAILSSFVMPKIETISDSEGNTAEGYGIFSILKIPSVLLAALSITISASTLVFLSATLEPHLRQFTLTPVQTGLMFIINGGVYAISAPILGYICDKFKKPIFISIFGAVFISISFLLIGPAPFVPVETMLWLVGIGLGVHGVGLAGCFVAGFISALNESMENGLPDNITTYGVVSGLWTSSLALGAFVGPSIGGILLDQVGFRNATYFPLASEIIFLIILIVFLIMRTKTKPGHTESAPLLRQPALSERKDLEVPSTSGYGSTTSASHV